ncbi:MAG: hypothetical protein ACOWWM_07090 [Desulfobacterales bacterium]
MIADKKIFFTGAVLLAGFLAVLFTMFMPIFGGGHNALNYLDNLYNSISKGSAYYIQGLQTDNKAYFGREVDVSFKAASGAQAENTAKLFWKAGAAAEVNGDELSVRGDLGRILSASLEDADLMFYNQGEAVRAKYDYDARQAIYNWWTALKGMDRELTKQKRFEDAKFVASVQARAVECAYNYFGIEPQKIGDKMWIVVLSLGFYVIYTLWFGYSIMFMFQGWGMDLEH